jgi:hypothetical protein
MAARSALLRLSAGSDQPAPGFAGVIVAIARKIDLALLHPYRPERHYMRGPGPRWHAKHGQAQMPIRRDG